jgi:hypothetical protein
LWPYSEGRKEKRTAGDVHGQYGELVSVEGEVEPQRVDEEEAHGRVQQRHRQQAAVGADAYAQHIVRHLERPVGQERGNAA